MVGRAADRGDPRALARGVGQHLPGLVGAAELEDADANHQDDRQRDCRLEESRAALTAGNRARRRPAAPALVCPVASWRGIKSSESLESSALVAARFSLLATANPELRTSNPEL